MTSKSESIYFNLLSLLLLLLSLLFLLLLLLLPVDPFCTINYFGYNKKQIVFMFTANYKPIHLLLKITLLGLMYCVFGPKGLPREKRHNA